jgi:hypothetical protein
MKSLSASLLHTAWTEKEKWQLDDLIAFVEAYAGDNFIADVCQYLFQLLNIDAILVGYQTKEAFQIQTIFFLHHGIVEPNFTYYFPGTPCSHVVGKDLYYIPFGVQAFFPDIVLLKKLEVESYLGMPLFGNQDQSLGLIVLLHQKLIEQAGFVEALLNVIAPRLEFEIQALLDYPAPPLSSSLETDY